MSLLLNVPTPIVLVKRGDYGYYLVFNIVESDGSTPKNLSGLTVKMKVWKHGEEEVLLEKTCEVTDAQNGVCRVLVSPGDFNTVGIFQIELECQGSDSRESTITGKLQVVESP